MMKTKVNNKRILLNLIAIVILIACTSCDQITENILQNKDETYNSVTNSIDYININHNKDKADLESETEWQENTEAGIVITEEMTESTEPETATEIMSNIETGSITTECTTEITEANTEITEAATEPPIIETTDERVDQLYLGITLSETSKIMQSKRRDMLSSWGPGFVFEWDLNDGSVIIMGFYCEDWYEFHRDYKQKVENGEFPSDEAALEVYWKWFHRMPCTYAAIRTSNGEKVLFEKVLFENYESN